MPETFTFEQAQPPAETFSFDEAKSAPETFTFDEATGDMHVAKNEPPLEQLVRPGWKGIPDTINLLMEGAGRAGVAAVNWLGDSHPIGPKPKEMEEYDRSRRKEYGKPTFTLAQPLTPEEAAQMPGPVAGTYNAVAKVANSLTNPEMLLTLPLFATKFAKPLAALFGAQMVANTPEAVQHAVDTAKSPDATGAEKWEAGVGAGLQAGLAGLAIKGAVETPKPPVPEAPQTVDAQLQWLKEGKRKAVLVTPGETPPEIPEGFETHPTEHGMFIFDPAKVKPEAIDKAVAENTVGNLLGYGIANKPAGAEATVTVRGPDGVEKQSVVTDAANADKVVAAAQKVADPGDRVAVEPATDVVQQRVQTSGPSPLVRNSINSLVDARQPVPAQLVEAFNQNAEAPYALPEGYQRQGDAFVYEAAVKAETETQALAREAREAMAELRAQKATGGVTEDPDWTVPEPTERPEPGMPVELQGERPPDVLDWIGDHFNEGVKIGARADYGEYLKNATGRAKELLSAKRGEGADRVLKAMHDEGVWPRLGSEDDLLDAMVRAGEARKGWEQQKRGSRDAIEAWLDDAIAATEANSSHVMEGVTGAPIWMTKAAANLALKAARFAYVKARDLPKAMEEGLKWLRAQNLAGFNEAEGRAWLETNLKGEPILQNSGRTIGAAVQEDLPIQATTPSAYGSLASASTLPFIEDLQSAVTGQGWRQRVQGWLGDITGKTFPRITAASREVGEQGAHLIASRVAAEPLADGFSGNVLRGTGLEDVEFGAALHEDNLRSLRKQATEQAAEAERTGQADRAAALRQQASKVFSFVGEGGVWPDEAAYQRYLGRANVQLAAERHRAQWERLIAPMYKEAMKLDPSEQLPARGEQLQARINLNFVREGEPIGQDVFVAKTPRGQLSNVLQRKSPFGRLAKGTAAAYRPSYAEAMRNTYTRQLEIANRNKFDRMLVENGQAVIDKPGAEVTIQGEPGIPFEIKRHIIQGEAGNVPVFQNIYVRKSLAGEYRTALNLDPKAALPVVQGFSRLMNGLAIAGLTDITAHTSNLAHALLNRPGLTRHVWSEIGLSLLGRADVPVALFKAFRKLSTQDAVRVRELAQIGALREPHADLPAWNPLTWGAKVIQKADVRTRLQLDRMYSNLIEQGLVERSETARREFVNQIGQYSRRAQGPIVRWFRDTGLGPFVTAGRAFNVLGARTMALNPGVKASSTPARLALAASMSSKWLGAAVLVGTVNYVLTHQKGGGVAGRPGVKLGAIDLGTNDKNGRPMMLNVFGLLGLERAGRVTGLRGAAEALYNHLPLGVVLDSAFRDIVNSWSASFLGPPIRAALIGTTGYQPASGVPRTAQVVPPGKSQALENIKTAAIEASPIASGIHAMMQPGATGWEAVQKQAGRFTLQPGKPPEMMRDYPGVVRRAQASAYVDDVIYHARRIELSKRMEYVTEALDKLDPQDVPAAMRKLQERGIIPRGVKIPGRHGR